MLRSQRLRGLAGLLRPVWDLFPSGLSRGSVNTLFPLCSNLSSKVRICPMNTFKFASIAIYVFRSHSFYWFRRNARFHLFTFQEVFLTWQARNTWNSLLIKIFKFKGL